MTTFFTRTGDDGSTGLLGEGRVDKFDIQIETLGTLDELTAFLGFARSLVDDVGLNREITTIQRIIYKLMAEVSVTSENTRKIGRIDSKDVVDLEKLIEVHSAGVEIPKGFIIPGDSQLEASLAVARTVTRRAERSVVELFRCGKMSNPEVLKYINRLSSYLFILELKAIHEINGSLPTLAAGDAK